MQTKANVGHRRGAPLRRLGATVLLALAAATVRCSAPGVMPPDAPNPAGTPLEATTPPVVASVTSPFDTSSCIHVPTGGFYEVWRDERVGPRLGCPLAPADAVTGTEVYLCDGTHSLCVSGSRLFFALPTWPQAWTEIEDGSHWPADGPLMDDPGQRSQPCFPVSGRHSWLARSLGDEAREPLARTAETEFRGVTQRFAGGWLLWNGDVCFVLFADHTWLMF
jgi:hypothetical protein